MPNNMTPEQQARWTGIKERVLSDRTQLVEYEEIIPVVQAMLTDEQALEVPNLYPEWTVGEDVIQGDRRRYGEGLYACKTTHKTQADWAPSTATASLWTRITNGDEWLAWAPGSWAKEAKVTHNDKKWISQVDNNVWEPGAAGVYANIWAEYVE